MLHGCHVRMGHMLHRWRRSVCLWWGRRQPLLCAKMHRNWLGRWPNKLLGGVPCHVSPTHGSQPRLNMW